MIIEMFKASFDNFPLSFSLLKLGQGLIVPVKFYICTCLNQSFILFYFF